MTEFELEKELEKIQARDSELWVAKVKLGHAKRLREEFIEKSKALAVVETILQECLAELK